MKYKIGSFNCLNYNGLNKKPDTYCKIIKKEQFDIVALQEIKRKEAIDQMLKLLGPDWTGEFDSDFRANDYAFLWNTKRFHLTSAETASGIRENRPRIYKQYKIDRSNLQTNLVREPYFARFTPSGLIGGGWFEIRILNAHVRFSKGKNSDEMLLPGEIAMRQNEVDVLSKTIYAKEADKIYGNNMPAYTILLGDYNLNKKDSDANSPYIRDEVIEIIDGDRMKRIVTLQSSLTTLSKASEDGSTENKKMLSNNYDHVTFDEIRYRGIESSVYVIDAVTKYCGGDYAKYKKEVSDHLPICITFNLKK
ncbi:MAG: hypothetical protein BWY15_01720 [Firmicutes bacterium ADurb.Bin193]|nr:MAG: hypothetical protein BWY15_01720 [Firmicutes bacterium ADurb.Bin193]